MVIKCSAPLRLISHSLLVCYLPSLSRAHSFQALPKGHSYTFTPIIEVLLSTSVCPESVLNSPKATRCEIIEKEREGTSAHQATLQGCPWRSFSAMQHSATSFAALLLAVLFVLTCTLSVEGMESAEIAANTGRQLERPLTESEHARPPPIPEMHPKPTLDRHLRPIPHSIPDRPAPVPKASRATRIRGQLSRALKAIFKWFMPVVHTNVYRSGKGFIKATGYQLPDGIYKWPEMEEDITTMIEALRHFNDEHLYGQMMDQDPKIVAALLPLYDKVTIPTELRAKEIDKNLSDMILDIEQNLKRLPAKGALFEFQERQRQMIQVKVLKVLSVQKGNEQATKAMQSVLEQISLRPPGEEPQLKPYLQAAYHLMQSQAAEVQLDRQLDLIEWLRKPKPELREQITTYHHIVEEKNAKLRDHIKVAYANLFTEPRNHVVDQQAELAVMVLLHRSLRGDKKAQEAIENTFQQTWQGLPTTHSVGIRLQEAVEMLDPKNMRTIEDEKEYRHELASMTIQSWSQELQGFQNIQAQNAYRSIFSTEDANRFKPIIDWAGYTIQHPTGLPEGDFNFALKTLFILSTHKPDGITDNPAFQKLMLAKESGSKQPSMNLFRLRMIAETMNSVTISGKAKKLTKADIEAFIPPPQTSRVQSAAKAQRGFRATHS